jgi:arylsulfatase A-like enzyme
MNRPKSRPNLLLVMIDCMRADFFYQERGPRNTTSLDHILQHGLSFTSFYSVTTTTTPCTATVLTGTYPITHGVRAHVGDRLRPGLKGTPASRHLTPGREASIQAQHSKPTAEALQANRLRTNTGCSGCGFLGTTARAG